MSNPSVDLNQLAGSDMLLYGQYLQNAQTLQGDLGASSSSGISSGGQQALQALHSDLKQNPSNVQQDLITLSNDKQDPTLQNMASKLLNDVKTNNVQGLESSHKKTKKKVKAQQAMLNAINSSGSGSGTGLANQIPPAILSQFQQIMALQANFSPLNANLSNSPSASSTQALQQIAPLNEAAEQSLAQYEQFMQMQYNANAGYGSSLTTPYTANPYASNPLISSQYGSLLGSPYGMPLTPGGAQLENIMANTQSIQQIMASSSAQFQQQLQQENYTAVGGSSNGSV